MQFKFQRSSLPIIWNSFRNSLQINLVWHGHLGPYTNLTIYRARHLPGVLSDGRQRFKSAGSTKVVAYSFKYNCPKKNKRIPNSKCLFHEFRCFPIKVTRFLYHAMAMTSRRSERQLIPPAWSHFCITLLHRFPRSPFTSSCRIASTRNTNLKSCTQENPSAKSHEGYMIHISTYYNRIQFLFFALFGPLHFCICPAIF